MPESEQNEGPIVSAQQTALEIAKVRCTKEDANRKLHKGTKTAWRKPGDQRKGGRLANARRGANGGGGGGGEKTANNSSGDKKRITWEEEGQAKGAANKNTNRFIKEGLNEGTCREERAQRQKKRREPIIPRLEILRERKKK